MDDPSSSCRSYYLKSLIKFSLIILCLVFAPANAHAQISIDVNIGNPLGGIFGGGGGGCQAQFTNNPNVISDPQDYRQFGQTQSVDSFFCTAQDRSDVSHQYIRQMFYVGAGIGVLALGILAAIGRFRWVWFFSLVGSLFLIAAFQKLIDFLN